MSITLQVVFTGSYLNNLHRRVSSVISLVTVKKADYCLPFVPEILENIANSQTEDSLDDFSLFHQARITNAEKPVLITTKLLRKEP